MYESTIEAKFYNKLAQWATANKINVEILKLNLKGRRGWPDRYILWDGGFSLFIEFKRPGEKPRPLQSYVHQRLRKMGFNVWVRDTTEEALEDVKTLIQSTTIAAQGTQTTDARGWCEAVLEAGPGKNSGGLKSI